MGISELKCSKKQVDFSCSANAPIELPVKDNKERSECINNTLFDNNKSHRANR